MYRNLLTACALFLAGCVDTYAPLSNDTLLFPEVSPETAGILDFANDPNVDAQLLDEVVAIDVRAAAAIIAHRDGADGVWGTADDDLFDSLVELDETPFVGGKAIRTMFEYAWLRGWMETYVRGFDGVGFTPSEARGTLWVANALTLEELDDELSLDRRAAAGILRARPIASMQELAAVDYVGESALRRLRDAAWIGSDWD
jgi:hypothetical protein